MKLTAAATAAAVGGVTFSSQADAASATWVGGDDLSGWKHVVGDGVWASPTEAPVSLGDLALNHFGGHSSLHANVNRRGIMAHNLAYTCVNELDSLGSAQKASVEFRLPDLPTTSNWDYNAQTLEVGLFIWDGPDTRLDYGMAIQWLLNPWLPDFGAIRAWQQNGDNPPTWEQVGDLEPDTEWHSLEIQFRALSPVSSLRIDSSVIDVDGTFTTKHDTWGDTIDGRFQVEVISVWPGANPEVPAHVAEFRNWAWRRPEPV